MESRAKLGLFALSALLAGLLALYASCLPLYVQGGDTGELVAAAFGGFVAHPPGYPLWVWLQRFWLQLLPFGSTPFWQASLLSALFAIFALGSLGFALKKSILSLVLCLPPLALSGSFLEAALLPDVFSLHALFIALIGSLFLFAGKGSSKLAQVALPFLFFLALSHHLTIILLFPLIAFILWDSRNSLAALARICAGAVLGLVISVSLYGSLLLLQPQSVFSWGELNDWLSVWNHFLRTDYGTFRLAAQGESAGGSLLLFLLRDTLPQIGALIAFSLWLLSKNRPLLRDSRLQCWAATSALSVLFFLVMNVNPQGMGAEVVKRFHLMPVMLLVLFCAFVIRQSGITRRDAWLGCAIVLPVSLLLLVQAVQLRQLRFDSVIEDYTLNLLAQADRRGTTVVITENDSSFFAARYAQAVLQKGSGIAVISPTLLFHPWFYRKVRDRVPDFRLEHPEKIWSRRELDFEKSLLLPNLGSLSFIVTKGMHSLPGGKVTFLGLGRRIGPGEGIAFDDQSVLGLEQRSRIAGNDSGLQSFTKKFLFAQYSHFFLARALSFYRAGENGKAVADWERALREVPYAFPALGNICNVKKGADPRCNEENFERVRREATGFF